MNGTVRIIGFFEDILSSLKIYFAWIQHSIIEKEQIDKIKINALNYPSDNTNLIVHTKFSNLKESTKDKNHDVRGQ